jgi:hypothetical protein
MANIYIKRLFILPKRNYITNRHTIYYMIASKIKNNKMRLNKIIT